MNKNVTFNIQVTINQRWADCFCSMLQTMESFGNMGHSGLVGFYADGDGDFRPKFDIQYPYEFVDGIPKHHLFSDALPEVMFDAG